MAGENTKKTKKCSKKKFSFEIVRRLNLYLRNMYKMQDDGVKIISSNQISRFLNVSSAQFRKDLSYFGEFGKRGVGYGLDSLIEELEKIVGTHVVWNVALVGAGKVGNALLDFKGFEDFNIKISCVFDRDKKKIGKVKKGIKIEPLDELESIVKKKKIKIAIIAVLPDSAQDIADRLVKAGVKGILNFASVILKVPAGIYVSNVDMACELKSLVFFVNNHCGS